MSGGTNFRETFDGNFIHSQSYCQKSTERKSPKKKNFFSNFVVMSDLGDMLIVS